AAMMIYLQKRVIDQNGRSPSSTENSKIRCGMTDYESLSQLLAMSAYMIDPTHKLEVSIMGEEIIINPIHSLFFKVFSSSLLFKIILVFRKYSLPV
ncbi:hypothetical protein ACSZMF_19820, partial [Aeromonas caviae]|uniref:hypothetical protein n=1 Tax=Aeromonas caviae TaxID=648 RepID=UPI003EC74F21